DAISESAEELIRSFQLFANLGRPAAPVVERGLGSGANLSQDRYNTPIEDLNLSVRAYNCLKRSGLMTVGQVLEKSEDELLALRSFGRKSYDELKDRLVEMGFIEPGAGGSSSGGRDEDDEDEDMEGGSGEDLGSLGAALMEALRGRPGGLNLLGT